MIGGRLVCAAICVVLVAVAFAAHESSAPAVLVFLLSGAGVLYGLGSIGPQRLCRALLAGWPGSI